MTLRNRLVLLISIIILPVFGFAQKIVLKPTNIATSFYHDKSKPLKDYRSGEKKEIVNNWPEGIVKNNFEKRKIVRPEEGSIYQKDRVLQSSMGTKQMNQTVETTFNGMGRFDAGGATPPDPAGDVGQEHYFQMVNLAFQIFDKSGTSAFGPVGNDAMFDGWDDGQPWDNTNDGDPIVLYDDQADRWMVSHFSHPSWNGPYYILIAYSVSSDPLGEYYRYAFQFNNFPDYPKFGIWSDGLYLTLNSNNNNVAVFQRDSMLVGGQASMISFSLPDYPGSGFKSALAADCDGPFPASGTPNYIMYYNDNAWGNYPTDHLRIWEFATNWTTTSNSTLTLQNTLVTEPFDSNFGSGWSNITQPNGQKIDAIAQAMMYRVQYRNFGTYEAMVCNYVVDVNGNDHAGIRWYELRKDSVNTSWYIYQQGTYAPDDDNRWLASIAMDKWGNIALAYSVSSSSTYPSLRFTGHTAGSPLGIMNVTETELFTGTGSQSGTNRYGDYSMLSVDATDDETFWFNSEYIPSSGQWETGIGAFSFGEPQLVPIDAGVVTFIGPSSGTGLTNQEAVSVLIGNFGTTAISNIPISLYVNNSLLATETISNSIPPAGSYTYTFSALADLSISGQYECKIIITYPGDTISLNDTLIAVIENLLPDYCAASGSTGYEYITRVTIEDWTNLSGGSQPYAFYQTDTVPLKLGMDHNIEVILGNGYNSDQVIAWFDWNHDLDFFDTGEKYIIGSGTGPLTNVIAVPSNALLGNSRMRVRLHDTSSGSNNTPCGSSDYGEVEDYTIFVFDPVAIETIYPDQLNLTCFPNPATDNTTITLSGINHDLIIQMVDENGKEISSEKVPASSSVISKNIDMKNLPAGMYFVKVRLSNLNVIDFIKLIKL